MRPKTRRKYAALSKPEAQNGDVLNDAVFHRNQAVEEAYNGYLYGLPVQDLLRHHPRLKRRQHARLLPRHGGRVRLPPEPEV